MVPDSAEAAEYYKSGRPGDAEAMGAAVAEAGNVVLPEWLGEGDQPLRPVFQWRVKHEFRPEWNDLGFVNLTMDTDTFVRHQILRAADRQGDVHPALAIAVFSRAKHLPEEWYLARQLQWQGRLIDLRAEGQMPINYVGPPGTIPTVPFHAVWEAAEGRHDLEVDLRDAIVLIGVTDRSQQDQHSTPYSNQSIANVLRSFWLHRKVERMAGVEIHANVIATLGDGAFITTPWWLTTWLLLTLAGAGLGAALMRMSLGWGALLTFAHHWAWKIGCLLAFRCGHWHVEAVAMLFLGMLVYGSVFAIRWRWMRQMMGMFKSEAVVRAMETDPRRLDLQGEECEISVMFSDVRDFTTFSEKHTPHEVVRLLNEYFTAIVPVIESHGGIVNQYIGDGLMVIFGAPESQMDHARRAVQAAVAAIGRVHALQDRWRELGAADFRIGIGIHTGKVVVGTIGSPRRLDYTAIGDTVNTASRIESANKELHTEVLVSEGTFASLSRQDRAVLAFRKDGRMERLEGPCQAKCTESGCQPSGVLFPTDTKHSKPRVAGWIAELPPMTAAGVTVARSGPPQPRPRLGPIVDSKVTASRPVFSWPLLSRATHYKLTLYLGPDPIWSATTTRTTLPYDSKRDLRPGFEYHWDVVAALDDGKTGERYEGRFSIATAAEQAEAAELKKLAASSEISLLALAAMRYQQIGLATEAIELYEQLAKLAPNEAQFYADLSELYRNAGREEDACRAHTKAEELGFPFPKSAASAGLSHKM